MKKWILIFIVIFSLILSTCGILPNGEGDDDMPVIDIGSPAIDRPTYSIAQKTRVDKSNPANASGVITTVEIWAETDLTDVEVAIFYVVSGNNLSTRSTAYIGNVTAGAKRTFTVNLDVEEGDFIGMYYSSGRMEAEEGASGSSYYRDWDNIPCTNQTFTVGSTLYSIYGIGTTIPTVTTQAVTDITHNSATGNGNITDTGGENITKRGFCWNTTGNPTIEDNKVEETGSFGTGVFTGSITGLDPVTKYYVKAYAYNGKVYTYGNEVNFTTNKTTPTVTVQSVTDILPTSATANGTITATGGEDCSERGFEYGLTKTATWTVKQTVGGYGVGTFSIGLTGLTSNTSYWIRAYAKNSIGTGYSDWIQFQTAAAGIIPTGTKIHICSDYSGYTYKLMRSETDDGEVYEAYFVVSTDLTNKQGLAYYKRILDLWLYFNKENSGTVTIYVKRDNEADWQTVGTVTLTGDEDIIIKHLAVDIRGKTFLFKLSASNHFEFLGYLFEFIKVGMR